MNGFRHLFLMSTKRKASLLPKMVIVITVPHPLIVTVTNGSSCTWLHFCRSNVRHTDTAKMHKISTIKTGSGAHPASYSMGNGRSLLGSKAAGTWSWTVTSIHWEWVETYLQFTIRLHSVCRDNFTFTFVIWIAQDKDRWRVLVYAVMNLRVL